MALTASLALSLVALGAGQDFLAAVPGGERLGAALGLATAEAQTPPRGCTHLEFTLTGNDGPQLVELAGAPGCGPLEPVVSGAPTYDRQRAVLRVPIALRNQGTTPLRAPVRLLGWTDSLVVVEPIGLAAAPAGTYASVLGPDTTLAVDSTAAFPGAAAWRFDSLLVAGAAPDAQTLAPGATSAVRWVELAVHQGVRRMRLAFSAEARPARVPVPPVPPDSIPKAVWDALVAPGNVLFNTPSVAGPVVRNAFLIAFRPEATTEDKEDLLSLIDGEVVGGTPAPLRFYAIRFPYPALAPGDSTSGHFLRTLIRVERHPAVHRVLFVYTESPYRPTYLRPVDGAGFQSWQLHRDSADGDNWGLEAVSPPNRWSGSDVAPLRHPVRARRDPGSMLAEQ